MPDTGVGLTGDINGSGFPVTGDAIKLDLADDPRPHDVKTLHGVKGLYRVRVGDYRIVYNIENKTITIAMVRVRRRNDAYRK